MDFSYGVIITSVLIVMEDVAIQLWSELSHGIFVVTIDRQRGSLHLENDIIVEISMLALHNEGVIPLLANSVRTLILPALIVI